MAMTSALLLFLATVAVGGASVVLPGLIWLRTLGTATLFAGLALIVVAVSLDVLDLYRSRRVIGSEIADLSGEAPDSVEEEGQEAERAPQHQV